MTSNMNDSSTNQQSATNKTSMTVAVERSMQLKNRFLLISRVLLIMTLTAVALVLGFLLNKVLRDSERVLGKQQFLSISNHSFLAARSVVQRKFHGAVALSRVVSYTHPDAAVWPQVTIDGFEDIAAAIIDTTDARDIGFAPLVRVNELSAFEDFAYDFFNTSRRPETFPPGTGESSFGKGVWGVDPTLNVSDKRYHMVDGRTPYPSNSTDLFPLLQIQTGAHPALMLNLRFEKERGKRIDEMHACNHTPCPQITEFLELARGTNTASPSALIFHPIYPANDSTVLVGLFVMTLVWDEILLDAFGESVRGIYAVVESESRMVSYHISNGAVVLVDNLEVARSTNPDEKMSTTLTEGLFDTNAPSYNLTLYSTPAFYDVYSTSNPRTAAIGASCVILFTSVLFILYDYFVRREFSAKRNLLEAKRKFMRYVSHEVRTPLNSLCLGLALVRGEIESALGLLSTEDKLPDQVCPSSDERKTTVETVDSKKVLDWLALTNDIHKNAQSAIDVLSDLLNYDKIENGKMNLDLGVVSIWNLIQRTGEEFALPAAKKNIAFTVEMISDEVDVEDRAFNAARVPEDLRGQSVVGDDIRIVQCLRNLLSNGLKFTPPEGSLTVTVSVTPILAKKVIPTTFTLSGGEKIIGAQSGWLNVNVVDTGEGITKDQQKKLFTAGVQFNANKLQSGQGSGLGLFITRGIVEQHGGTMSVTSEGINKGTTFVMTLPLYVLPEATDTAQSGVSDTPEAYGDEHTHSADLPEEMQSMRILVVDDSDMNRKLLVRLLKNHGHDCDEAVNGEEAVAAVKRAISTCNPYDTLLLDYEMPIMDGPTAAAQIRTLGCDSFIVGITGNILPEDVDFFKRCGANGVLPKPFSMVILENLWVEYGITGKSAHVETPRKTTFRLPSSLCDDGEGDSPSTR